MKASEVTIHNVFKKQKNDTDCIKGDSMKPKITIATVSGRAYYKLVNELRRRNLSFWSVKPWDLIPLNTKVIITTKEEQHLVNHPDVLIFDYESDPAMVVNEAIRVVKGKRNYNRVVVGVDPGKTYGVAVIGDDEVLKTFDCSSLGETVNVILNSLKELPATSTVVRVGNGAPTYAKELLRILYDLLPSEAFIEVVREAGTSRPINNAGNRREFKNVMSAKKIARKKGQILPRKKIL